MLTAGHQTGLCSPDKDIKLSDSTDFSIQKVSINAKPAKINMALVCRTMRYTKSDHQIVVTLMI